MPTCGLLGWVRLGSLDTAWELVCESQRQISAGIFVRAWGLGYVCACMRTPSTPVSVSKPDLACVTIQTIPGSLYPKLAPSPLGVIGLAAMTELAIGGCAEAAAWGDKELAVRGHREVTEAPNERQTGRE